MADPYKIVSSDMPSSIDPNEDYFFVQLYPYNSNMESYCSDGSVVTEAIQQAGEDLLSYGAIDGWEITRLRTPELGGDGNYFEKEWGGSDTDDVFGEFYQRFISKPDFNNIPTGYGDLSGYGGCHHLIHDRPAGCDELDAKDGNEDGFTAPAGASANSHGSNSFATSTGSWAPVCSNTSFTEAAAVQEVVHTFVDEDYYQSYWGTITQDDGYEDHEHTLGRVSEFDSIRTATPMLTYHWDDNITDNGDCASYTSDPVADTHTRRITDCTKRAVYDTAQNH